jgi:predicted DNA-binding transcriptional regulator
MKRGVKKVFCEDCLVNVIIPKLKDNDLLIMEYLYNHGITLPQTSKMQDEIIEETGLSNFKGWKAVYSLRCYNLVKKIQKGRANYYYLTKDGKRALSIFSEQIANEHAEQEV